MQILKIIKSLMIMLVKTEIRIVRRNSLRLKLKIINDVTLLIINFLIIIIKIKFKY